MKDSKKYNELMAKLKQKDRTSSNAGSKWDSINSMVNEVYGVDLSEALAFWEAQHGELHGEAHDICAQKKVIVVISGGLMQSAYANCDVNVDLFDFDNASAEGEDAYQKMESDLNELEKAPGWKAVW